MSFKSRERYWKDRRKHPRKRVVWPATLETVRGRVLCRVSNISPGGARLRVDEPVLVGEYVTLAIPAHGEFEGIVAWQRDSVIGMQFGDYDLRAQRSRLVTSDAEPQTNIADPPSGEIGEMAPPVTLTAPLADVDRIPLEPSIRWPEESDLPPAPPLLAASSTTVLLSTSMANAASVPARSALASRERHRHERHRRLQSRSSRPPRPSTSSCKSTGRATASVA